MQWHACHTTLCAGLISSAEPVAVTATLCLMKHLLSPALYYTCANQVPSFLSRTDSALIVDVLCLKIHEFIRITGPCPGWVIPIPRPLLQELNHPYAWCDSRYNCFPSQAVFCLPAECLGPDPQMDEGTISTPIQAQGVTAGITGEWYLAPYASLHIQQGNNMASLCSLHCTHCLGNGHGFHFHVHGNSLLSLSNNTTNAKATTHCCHSFSR